MAKVEFSGADELLKQLMSFDLYDNDTQAELLYAGGDLVAGCIRDEMEQSSFNLRDMAKNVKYAKRVRMDKYGNRYIFITVEGKNQKGVSNAQVIFVLNYGRAAKYGEIIGGHFWNRGWQNADAKVPAAMEEKLNKILSERGLN